MRKIFIFVFLFSTAAILSGCCLFFGPQGDAVFKEMTARFRISVTSEPPGADVFYKGTLLGQTPLKKARITVDYYLTGSGMIISNGWGVLLPEKEYIILEKEGFKPAKIKLSFMKKTFPVDLTCGGSSRLHLKSRHLHVELRTKEVRDPAKARPVRQLE